MKDYSKSIYILTIFSLQLFIVLGCCDCLDPAEDPTELPCSVREVTITMFDARVNILEGNFDEDPELDTIYDPVDSYNIHAFRFGSGNNTGSLDNDIRFDKDEGIDRIAVEEYSIPNFRYKLAIFDNAPANEDINGDILIEDVQITDPGIDFAIMRVKGYIGYYRQDFWSESSSRFCEYIRTNNDDIIERFISSDGNQDYSQYGADIQPPRLVTTSINDNFGIIDNNGNIIIENIDDLTNDIDGFTPAQLQNFAAQIERKRLDIYSIRIEVGDVFYYIADNGREYLFAVISIDERDSEGQQDPAVKKRVSIIFSEL